MWRDELTRAALDYSPLAIVVVDEDYRVVLWNKKAERMFGWMAEEVLGKAIPNIPGGKASEFFRMMEEVKRGGEELEWTQKMMRKDGKLFDVAVHVSPVFDRVSGMTHYISVIEYVTEGVRLDAELREMEYIIERSPLVVFLWRNAPGWPVDYVSRNVSLFGYAPEDFTEGRILYDKIIHPEDLPRVEEEVDRYTREGRVEYTQEYRILTASGDVRWVDDRTWVRRDERGNVTHYQGIVLDITDRKLLEQRLREEKERYRYFTEEMSDVLFTLDLNLNLTYESPSVKRLLGQTPEERMKLPIEKRVTPESLRIIYDTLAQELALEKTKKADPDRVVTLELQLLDKEGKPRWFEVALRGMRNERKRVVGFLGVARDIEERKRVEEELRRLNAELEERVKKRTLELEAAVQDLEAFTYSVSHDLRAPLRSIDGFCAIIAEEYGDLLDEKVKGYFIRIRKAVSHMSRLIDDLLRLSRLGRGELIYEEVDLSRMAREIVDRLREKDRAKSVEVVIHEGMWTRGDRRLLVIALVNLIDNSWKFTVEKEEAYIEVGQTMTKDGNRAFFVKDNGVGFDMRYASKLFTPFQRLHSSERFPGTGIGLVMVKRIIERHGGKVWFESVPGEGATFYFTLGGT
ncbi:MAG: PAS domain S-box protein [Syntrophales bacterium]|nr:PAS domain S-box protein [Syntrophales bacterium]